MDCNFWSCFVHEDERLLIGGLHCLEFTTIRNIAQSENYTQYIKILNILDNMILGLTLPGMKPNDADVKGLQQLINLEGDGYENQNSIPKYVQSLFHHFVMKQNEVVINLLRWNNHYVRYYEQIDTNVYGYKKFAKLFSYNHSERMIDFNIFIKLFPNLITLIIGDFNPRGVNDSIDLSNDFILKIFECIEYLNKSSSTSSFTRFEIVKPSSSITDFIHCMQDQFEINGWRLKKEVFVGKGIFSRLPNVEMLSIEKIKN